LIAVLERGVSLSGFDVIPVRLIILFLCSKTDDYPSLIAQSIRLCTDDNFRANACKCKDSGELIRLIGDWELK
jgi:mannitol/fructose-specific phosphotransferase system IIA component (Ntr-type)